MNLPPINATASAQALPRRLVPRPWKYLRYLAVFLGLGAYSVWYALQPHDMRRTVFSWLIVAMAIFGSIQVALSLLPGWRYLELTSQGFSLKIGLRTSVYVWGDVKDFGAARYEKFKFVGFNFVEGRQPKSGPSRLRARLKEMSGYDSALGMDDYGMSPEELADLMNTLRRRYAGGGLK